MDAQLWVLGSTHAHRADVITAIGGKRLVLDTKYYTASIAISSVDAEHGLQEHLPPDGVILVFSDHAASPTTAEQNLLSSLAEHADVQVCISDMACGPSEELVEQRQHWAANACYEHVDVHSQSSAADLALTRDGERQGFQRVREALEAHTWPGLQMKPRPQLAAARPNGRASVLNNSTSQAPQIPSLHASSMSSSDSDSSTNFDAFQGSHTLQKCDSPQPAESLATEHAQDEQSKDTVPNDKLDADDSQFETMLQELRGQRSSLQTMSDVDRRDRAAAAAIKMMQMFGLDDESGGVSETDL